MLIHLMILSELDDDLGFVLSMMALIHLAKRSMGKRTINGKLTNLAIGKLSQQKLRFVLIHCFLVALFHT